MSKGIPAGLTVAFLILLGGIIHRRLRYGSTTGGHSGHPSANANRGSRRRETSARA